MWGRAGSSPPTPGNSIGVKMKEEKREERRKKKSEEVEGVHLDAGADSATGCQSRYAASFGDQSSCASKIVDGH